MKILDDIYRVVLIGELEYSYFERIGLMFYVVSDKYVLFFWFNNKILNLDF